MVIKVGYGEMITIDYIHKLMIMMMMMEYNKCTAISKINNSRQSAFSFKTLEEKTCYQQMVPDQN